MNADTNKKIDNLAKMMEKGFKDAEVRTDEKIDSLARMTAEGFKRVDERFDGVENKIETLETKVDGNFREVNMKLHDIGESISRHSTRIEKLEEKTGVL